MSNLQDELNNLDKLLFRMNKSESTRRNLLHYTRIAAVAFIIIVSLYSSYLFVIKKVTIFNYGLAWWIALLLLILGFVGSWIAILISTNLVKQYNIQMKTIADIIYYSYIDSCYQELNPYIETSDGTIRNKLFLDLFEILFWDFSKEIQEDYINKLRIFYFPVNNIPGLSTFVNIDLLSKCIGEQIAKKNNVFFYYSLDLRNKSTVIQDSCIVVYALKK